MTTLTTVEVCCDNTCENYNTPRERELTAEEISDREAMAAQAEADRLAAEEAKAASDAAKASAEAKLSALGLTAEEIAALSK